MTIKWTEFPASVTAGASDIIVGLAGGTTNARFNANSWLFVANNLSDVASKTTSFDNISPLTTTGDLLLFGGGHNARLPIGTNDYILSVSGGTAAWVANPGLLIANNLSDLASLSTALTNLGLSSTSAVNFGVTTGSSSTASATPGTIRALIGSITGSNSVMTSGNLVGARGVANIVGASGGFIYGAQGKVISTGSLSGSSWSAGVFGQLDISAATINAGQVAPIWGDYGASSGTLTDQSGLYGIAMTNTTAAVLAGQLYLYGGAQNLMLLNTNAGLSGVTYFKNAGTSAGSWGNAVPPTPSKVLTISVDGVQYYLPLVAQNT